MPAFADGERLVTQHRAIHEGLGKLEYYALNCLQGNVDSTYGEIKEILDSFGSILWEHLDEEVEALGAEQTRKYWSAEEMNKMPM